MRNDKRHGRKGATLVESALVSFCLLVTTLGIVDLGQFLLLEQTFRERVRAGVRYAIVHDYDPQQIRNVVLYNSPTAGARGLFGLTSSMVTVNRYDAGTPEDRIEVSISEYPMKFYSPLLGRFSLKPTFRAVMAVESLGATE